MDVQHVKNCKRGENMKQYKEYAQQLDAAFKEAREEFLNAWDTFQAAKKANEDAKGRMVESYRGEAELKRATAREKLKKAEHDLKSTESRVWAEFDRKKEALRASLEKEVRDNYTANPDAIDPNAVELLKTGVLGAYDFCSLADKHADNPTMLRIIEKYAKEAANNANGGTADRETLHVLCSKISSGQRRALNDFDALCRTADYCSGRVGTYRSSHAVTMSKKWEQLSSSVTEEI